jgi:kinesin family protein 4/21/27
MSFLLHFQVNRNPIADEMKRMRQQIEYLQAELVSARGGVGSDDVQGLRERISWLEHINEDLCRELYDIRNRSQTDPCEPEMQKTLNGFTKSEGLKRSLQSTDPFDVPMTDSVRGNFLAPLQFFHQVFRCFSFVSLRL